MECAKILIPIVRLDSSIKKTPRFLVDLAMPTARLQKAMLKQTCCAI